MDCATWHRIGWASALVFLGLASTGCGRDKAPVFPTHLQGFQSASPNPGFALYVEAAQRIEQDAAKQIRRVTWTPDQRAAAIRSAHAALDMLRRAQREQVEYIFTPYSPFAPPPEWRGWRFLGRIMAWQIETSLRDGNHAAAVSTFLQAARFGTDLSGGNALDANLGYTIIAECSGALWRAVSELSVADLNRLYVGLARVMENAPSVQTSLRNESASMMAAVETVQGCFLSNDLEPLADALGEHVRPALKHLERLRSGDAADQVAYFERFAAEAEDESANLLRQAAISPHLWEGIRNPTGERPWRRFATHYFQNGRFLLACWAENTARTRLLAVDAYLLAKAKQGVLPASLKALPVWVRTDPFSGQDFVYVPQGTEFKLYSYGPDRKDDGGETGPAGAAPDLRVR